MQFPHLLLKSLLQECSNSTAQGIPIFQHYRVHQETYPELTNVSEKSYQRKKEAHECF
jgi:hypothetical protein